jgi:hypothetical protein
MSNAGPGNVTGTSSKLIIKNILATPSICEVLNPHNTPKIIKIRSGLY